MKNIQTHFKRGESIFVSDNHTYKDGNIYLCSYGRNKIFNRNAASEAV
jgi:hypothetical protein